MSFVETDPRAVREALGALIAPGATFEIRALHASQWRGMLGYFNDPDLAADAVCSLDEDYQGIYVTLNPLDDDCVYRANNTLIKFVPNIGSTDGDVIGRNWLPIDIDPIRRSGISSTDAEQRYAIKTATAIADWLDLGRCRSAWRLAMNHRYRTPLKGVRGLGSAKEGTHHFLVQRLTAVALVVLAA